MKVILPFVVLAFAMFEYVPILKGKDTKLKWVYGVIVAVSFTAVFLHELDVKVPSMSSAISYVVNTLLKLK